MVGEATTTDEKYAALQIINMQLQAKDAHRKLRGRGDGERLGNRCLVHHGKSPSSLDLWQHD